MGVGNTDHEISAEEYNRIKGLDPSMQLEALAKMREGHGSMAVTGVPIRSDDVAYPLASSNKTGRSNKYGAKPVHTPCIVRLRRFRHRTPRQEGRGVCREESRRPSLAGATADAVMPCQIIRKDLDDGGARRLMRARLPPV